MILLPAVDIRDGRAVRLRQGHFDDETVYADTPLEAQLEMEARAMATTTRTADTWEGITAVAARRAPEFHGA